MTIYKFCLNAEDINVSFSHICRKLPLTFTFLQNRSGNVIPVIADINTDTACHMYMALCNRVLPATWQCWYCIAGCMSFHDEATDQVEGSFNQVPETRGFWLWSGMERDGLLHTTLPKTHHIVVPQRSPRLWGR